MSAASLWPDPVCYVRGCRGALVGGALHRDFGRVNCCAAHWPERGSRARVFGGDAAPQAPPEDHYTLTAGPRAPIATLDMQRPADIPDPF